MRDYCDETDTPVEKMSTSDISLCLSVGFELDGTGVPREAIVERLRLELFIREKNLRAGL